MFRIRMENDRRGGRRSSAAGKILAWLLAGAVLLSGCGAAGSAPVSQASSSGTSASSAVSAASSEKRAAASAPAPASAGSEKSAETKGSASDFHKAGWRLKHVPLESSEDVKEINGGMPYFTRDEKRSRKIFMKIGSFDRLGRATASAVCAGKSSVPKSGTRGSIGMFQPTGWVQNTYPKSVISERYLYNRCHVIGWVISGIDISSKYLERDLVTGTRQMNTEMIPYEEAAADHARSGGRVRYRVTPYFRGNDLLCRGVEMEGYSTDDGGKSVCFHVFIYNKQEGIDLDYADGSNQLNKHGKAMARSSDGAKASAPSPAASAGSSGKKVRYVLNVRTGVFHLPNCSSVKKMSKQNRKTFTQTKKWMIRQGYQPCDVCLG